MPEILKTDDCLLQYWWKSSNVCEKITIFLLLLTSLSLIAIICLYSGKYYEHVECQKELTAKAAPAPAVVETRRSVDSPFDYPFLASLQVEIKGYLPRTHVCAASILTDRWILTSAYCVSQLKDLELESRIGFNLYVHVGSLSWKSGGSKFQAIKWLPHQDIGMVKIYGAFEWSHSVLPIKLIPEKLLKPSSLVKAIGWASFEKVNDNEITSEVPKDTIRTVTLLTTVIKNCTINPKVDLTSTPDATCTGFKVHDIASSCVLDGGGPLVTPSNTKGSFYLVAILPKLTFGCFDHRGSPHGVYENVAEYASWIQEKIANDFITIVDEKNTTEIYIPRILNTAKLI